MKKKLWFFIICIGFIACNGSNKERVPLANAFGESLYAEDIRISPGDNRSKEDSILLVNAFINDWIKNRVIAHKAELNLNAEEKDVKKQMDEYRNALLIYRYKQKLVSERLDTTVKESQVKKYFEQNKKEFETNRNLVRLKFVKMKRRDPSLRIIKKLMFTDNKKNDAKLSALCEQHSLNYFLNDEAWLDFDEVKKELPIQSYSDEHFLQNNKFLEITEGEYIYVINIIDFKTRNKFAMLEPERDRIRKIILRERAQTLIREMEINVVKEAELSHEIEKMP